MRAGRWLILATGWLSLAASSPGQNNAIFAGGNGDGAATAVTSAGPAPFVATTNAIFGGGNGDGSTTATASSGDRPFVATTNGIFGGGTGDGYDFHRRSGDQSPFESYMASFGIRGGPAEKTHDFDLDGWLNVEEFGYGSHPGDPRGLPQIFCRFFPGPSGEPIFGLVVPRRKGGAAGAGSYAVDGLVYTPEGTRDMRDWRAGLYIEVRDDPGLPEGYQYSYLGIPFVDQRGTAWARGFVRMRLDY